MNLIKVDNEVGVMFILVMIFCFLDFVAGFYKGLNKKEVSSKKMKHGLFNFCAIIVVMIIAEMGAVFVDIFHLVPNAQIWICGAVSAYFIIMEIVSILENLYDAGFKYLPPTLIQYLKKTDTSDVGDDIVKAAIKIITRKELNNDHNGEAE